MRPYNTPQKLFSVQRRDLDLFTKLFDLEDINEFSEQSQWTFLGNPEGVQAVIFAVGGKAIDRKTEKEEKRLFERLDSGRELL